MKSKDQTLLEEAYDKIHESKIDRYATSTELELLKSYLDGEQLHSSFFDPTKIDLSKGWVWNQNVFQGRIIAKNNDVVHIVVRDKNDVFSDGSKKPSKEQGHSTFAINLKRHSFTWQANIGQEDELVNRAIKTFEMKQKLPELEGIF